ncbi:OFA family MFS transporter [Actinacidiphila oryziradicis]|uniref:OFA family MFS transporter n=1 Tax=Actinacidiphila oryziradicis TaxID=2571141 RepID=A0A4U0RLW8_9ACTN|nr:OFA family MFS transporter [Actinacidiphila oryziradicis]TJZ96833.1 OFA family MFS transporter [Actinacidiphila oryziradicis]
MALTSSGSPTYTEIVNETGRIFRVGETPKQLLGYPRWVVIMAAWFAMCLSGLVEYTWGALSGSLASAHHWGEAPVFWLFSCFVVFESLVQIGTGMLRSKGVLPVKFAVIVGGVVCGILAYSLTAYSTKIWEAYLGYAVLGGIGSGMVYSSAINIVAKWYPEKKGWRTGFVNGGWAYGSVPFILVIGGISTGAGVGTLSPPTVRNFILVQGIIMTVGIFVAGLLMKDPPKSWWPADVDPLNWAKNKRTARDLLSNPPAHDHYTLRQMWYTPQAKWLGIQYALYIGCSLFGVAYYYGFGVEMHLGTVVVVAGAAGFSLADGGFRPFYGWLSEYIGRRRTMAWAYSLNVIFQMLALVAGLNHQGVLFAVCAVISGGLSGACFPMTAAAVADYYGENNNAVNYGSIYAWKALGGSFAGGVAALIMTGTLYGSAHFHWTQGFIFGSALGALAALTVYFKCKPPTLEQRKAAVAKAAAAHRHAAVGQPAM